MNDPQTLLVDSHHGIYCYKVLSENFPLFYDTGLPFSEQDLADLRGDDWPDQVDWLESSSKGLNVKDESGLLYRVESIDGDLWAIHPQAAWNECQESWEIES